MNSIEILTKISERLIKATMMHSNFTDLMKYLGFTGLSKTQEYQYTDENYEMVCVNRYAVEHLGKMVKVGKVSSKSYIPTEFADLDRASVNEYDKSDVIRYFIETWITWETQTKEIYSNYCTELNANHDVATELFVEELVKGVDDELKRASEIGITFRDFNYNLSTLAILDRNYYNEYCNKMTRLFKKMRKEVSYELR